MGGRRVDITHHWRRNHRKVRDRHARIVPLAGAEWKELSRLFLRREVLENKPEALEDDLGHICVALVLAGWYGRIIVRAQDECFAIPSPLTPLIPWLVTPHNQALHNDV